MKASSYVVVKKHTRQKGAQKSAGTDFIFQSVLSSHESVKSALYSPLLDIHFSTLQVSAAGITASLVFE